MFSRSVKCFFEHCDLTLTLDGVGWRKQNMESKSDSRFRCQNVRFVLRYLQIRDGSLVRYTEFSRVPSKHSGRLALLQTRGLSVSAVTLNVNVMTLEMCCLDVCCVHKVSLGVSPCMIRKKGLLSTNPNSLT